MKTPTIHLNGTSGEELLKNANNAIKAAREFTTALVEIMPNARDFYPQGEQAAKDAQAAYLEMMQKVHDIRQELEEYRAGISTEMRKRAKK